MNYEIKSEFLKAKINSFGAELNSLQKLGNDCEYIWQADDKYWARHSPILFPIVGRLKEDSYIYKDKKYSMSQHGIARDKKFEVVKNEENFIEFKLCNDEKSLEIYPFLFELIISYKLEKSKLIISYKVVNKSNETMFFSIGAHPAFNWALEKNLKKEDYFLEFEVTNAKRYFLNNLGLVYKNKDLEFEDKKLFLNEELFKDDALIFNDFNIKQVVFKSSKSDKFVKVNFDNFPYLGIWSKPSGAPFLCIEPWFGVADDKNSNQKIEEKRGINSLKKDEEFSCSYSIEI
ncbi:aldose 1-epimerase family protein [Arcobacter aquimarinus]|uniref:Aldose 1-epimerase n=1 Tax=Arcobacter aquimarinus TaxID=1315211 RepID=A0AAE7B3N9_9BACT|nr:aldose 1-epimerase family protein [Arcobacter aquimarinus]QKE26431.1 aldose 1-epimerase [Arcobacter aquimarinus]RXI33434.1 aldose epimerase [Arcobacter aquimarinus]